MLEIRITVLRDRPASDVLKKHTPNGYRLFLDTETNLYFLIEGRKGRFAPSPFWGGYDPVLNLPYEADTVFLDQFGKDHAGTLDYYTAIDPLMVQEAVALSEAFSTRVLCAYANDEDDDFAVVADKGELVRVRFEAGRRRGKRLDDATASKIDTEFQAVRIYRDTDSPDPENDGVFEYTAYEGLQTEDQPLTLQPYWEYVEGEIGREVVFRTIRAIPDDSVPDLMFRNAFLEFEAAFNTASPDFTNMADPDRFKEVAFKAPPKPSIFELAFKSLLRFVAYILAKPKRMLAAGFILLVLLAGMFGEPRDDRTRTQIRFADDCEAVQGTVLGDDQNLCRIGDRVYENWNLPGDVGESRPMAFVIGPSEVPCSDGSEQMCLQVNGKPLDLEIEGFTRIDGQPQIVFVDRLQRCDPKTDPNCSTPTEMFRFKRRVGPDD